MPFSTVPKVAEYVTFSGICADVPAGLTPTALIFTSEPGVTYSFSAFITAWSNLSDGTAVDAISNPDDIDLSDPSDGLFITFTSLCPSGRAANVVDPPPSRFIADTHPCSSIICASSCIVPPHENGS